MGQASNVAADSIAMPRKYEANQRGERIIAATAIMFSGIAHSKLKFFAAA